MSEAVALLESEKHKITMRTNGLGVVIFFFFSLQTLAIILYLYYNEAVVICHPAIFLRNLYCFADKFQELVRRWSFAPRLNMF